MATAEKNSSSILSEKSDFHTINNCLCFTNANIVISLNQYNDNVHFNITVSTSKGVASGDCLFFVIYYVSLYIHKVTNDIIYNKSFNFSQLVCKQPSANNSLYCLL